MEEVYVIRLRGVPSATSESSASAADARDLLRGSVLGLGVLHVVLGLLVTLLGVLRWGGIDHEPPAALSGALFGPLFVATGVSAFFSWRRPFRKLKLKALFWLSVISLVCAATLLALCVRGAAQHHATPRLLGDAAHLAANGAVAALAEGAVALLSAAAAGGAVWRRLRRSPTRSAPHKRKVIVKTDILSGQAPPPDGADVIRHVSPHCVISLRATDEQREVIKRVQEYLHAQDELSFTFSDPSTLHEEQDLGLDSEHWGNEVMSVDEEEEEHDDSRQTVDTSLSSAS